MRTAQVKKEKPRAFHYTIVEALEKITMDNLHELKPLLELISGMEILANHGNILNAIRRFNFYPKSSEGLERIHEAAKHVERQLELARKKSRKNHQERKMGPHVVK